MDTAWCWGLSWLIASALMTLDDKVHVDATLIDHAFHFPLSILEVRIWRIAVQHVRKLLPVPLL